jgi:acetylornithine/succinyldiaminopimelate/putrescine aminotransferase
MGKNRWDLTLKAMYPEERVWAHGTMFATERFGVVPDLMTMAKGLSSGYAPIAAVAVGAQLFDEFKCAVRR